MWITSQQLPLPAGAAEKARLLKPTRPEALHAESRAYNYIIKFKIF
jgi:hypothetical protein